MGAAEPEVQRIQPCTVGGHPLSASHSSCGSRLARHLLDSPGLGLSTAGTVLGAAWEAMR